MKENFEIRYDFIAKDGSRHQDMDSVRIANDRYWEYINPKKINKIGANELDLKTMLRRQFKEKFELATYEITMMNIDFKEWDRYYILLMDALKSGVVSPQEIVAFARNLRSASVITITIPEHEEYLKNQKVLNGIIDKINLEQGQARR